MQYLFQIPPAMLNSIWLMSILFTLYLLLKWIGNLSPAKSFLLAVGFEVIAGVHFIFSILYPSSTSYKLTTISIDYSTNWINWTPLIGVLYCVVLICYLIYLVIDYNQINDLKSNADFSNNSFWNKILQQNGLDPYLIGASKVLETPITFGWMDAVILLPISILNHLSVEEVKFILLHEVAHIIRHDFLIQILLKATHSILLFNPFSYFFSNEINVQRELACDAWVLKKINNPLAYSKSLYQLALVANKEHNQFILNAIGTNKEVLTRIQFLNKLPIQSKYFKFKLTFSCLIFIFTSIGFKSNKSIQPVSNIISAHKQFINKTNDDQIALHQSATPYKKSSPKIIITRLHPSFETSTPIKEEDYAAAVTKAANWIKERENPYQFVNYSNTRDSLEFEIAEKLMLRSLIQNYQLRKELLNAKLASIASEKEAIDFLEHSKEWKDILQYESWASAFLKRHPEVAAQDSLRRF